MPNINHWKDNQRRTRLMASLDKTAPIFEREALKEEFDRLAEDYPLLAQKLKELIK